MTRKKVVVIGSLGTTLDQGKGPKRWEHWRPTVATCQHESLLVDRFELLYGQRWSGLADVVVADIAQISPETVVRRHLVEYADPWALDEVYEGLYAFARNYDFRPDDEEYLIHITTGTHIAQISMFLLAESRYFPARLLQTAPATRAQRQADPNSVGSFAIIDLDLSKYDRIASRFQKEQREGLSYLKSGIDTRNADFNRMVERIEYVAMHAKDPILLTGPTGAGKSQLAKRLFELKKSRRQVDGEFASVNCATLRGDAAMSALFGHVKGAFTGAMSDRPGMLRKANRGVLFLDEVGELGLDEQAMLLRAIEEKSFYPVGSDREVKSDFQLFAGTNRHLRADVRAGRFREDLLARINLWTFKMPGLSERSEDIEPNLDFELEQCARAMNLHVTISREARALFLQFATSKEALWSGNFREFNAAIRRMATLCNGGRIATHEVHEEVTRLRELWQSATTEGEHRNEGNDLLERFLGRDKILGLDLFDRVQLAEVLRVCLASTTLSDAGRILFQASRAQKQTPNDADRLRKYLARFELSWQALRE